MNVVARAVTLVEVLVAAQMQQIELIDQAIPLEHVHCAIHGDAVDARVDLLGAFQDVAHVEMCLGIIHHFNQNPTLAREANTVFFQGFLDPSRGRMGVNPLAGGYSMFAGGHSRDSLPSSSP